MTLTRVARRGRPPAVAEPGQIDARASILAAATREFSQKGFDGGRMDDIAKAASVSKNSLYYHFGSKDELFLAVLEEVYTTIRGRHNEVSLRGLPPDEAMRKLVRHTASIWIEYPEFGRLLASENLQEARHMRQSRAILTMYNPLVENIRLLLAAGVAEGVFRDDVNPIDLYISVAALSAYYIAHHHSFDALFHENLMAPARLEERISHAEEMILGFLHSRCRTKSGQDGERIASPPFETLS